MTERLYYDDSYLQQFRARVVETSGNAVYLDRTAFYPSSGGQPFDRGSIGGAGVVDVVDEGERIAHVVDAAVAPGEVECSVDWTRRFDHMQQHTGQHLLSAVLVEAFRIPTVSFHLGQDVSTIDIETGGLSASQIAETEERVNRAIWENRPVTVSYHDASDDIGLRKESNREGTLRVVTIRDVDRSACGGTHVRSTGEIGLVLLRKLDKVRGNVRIEFLCGLRALRQARADFDGLSKIGRAFSASFEELPGLVAAQNDRLTEAEKVRKKLAGELAALRGKQLHASAQANGRGLRVEIRRVDALDDELRIEAQSFTNCGGAVFIATAEKSGAVLLAASADSGIRAGEALKPLLTENGGRGGGNPQMAQGSVPDAAALESIAAELRALTD